MIGPAWTRGEMERPLGEESRGSFTIAVYTPEQQARLGVDELGGAAKQKAPRHSRQRTPPTPTDPTTLQDCQRRGLNIPGPAWTWGGIEKPLGRESKGSYTVAVYTHEQQDRLQVDKHGKKVDAAATPKGSQPSCQQRPPAGARKQFPAHWGDPPAIQTRDYRNLPGGYGHGSSTMASWIMKNLASDAADAVSPMVSAASATAQAHATAAPPPPCPDVFLQRSAGKHNEFDWPFD